MHAGTISHKLKDDWKCLGWTLKILWVNMAKNWCGQSGNGTLKLTMWEWTDGIYKLIFCMLIHELKADQIFFWLGMVKNGCGHSGHKSKKWTDRLKSFILCWYEFRKTKVDSTVFGKAWSKMAMAF